MFLCGPMDCSPPGSAVPGILQARILEWVAMPFSRGQFVYLIQKTNIIALMGGKIFFELLYFTSMAVQ